MGLGDWIMATAQAKALHEVNGRPVFVMGGDNRPQWPEEIFANNPRLTRREVPGSQRLVSGGGVRPYIAGKTAEQWQWKTWNIQPGEIYLTDAEKALGTGSRGYLIIEPNTKVPQGNKWYPWDRWLEVVAQIKVPFAQLGPRGTRLLPGARHFVTDRFRLALAYLSASSGYVGVEGACHHAAAALNLPAVVIWSEFIDPIFTGYTTHRNIRHAGPACGARIPCKGCRESMERISPDEIVSAIRQMHAEQTPRSIEFQPFV